MNPLTRAAGLALILAGALSLAGCGKQGILERPAPLFGQKAKAEYNAQEAAKAKAAADAAAAKRSANGETQDNSDNAPRTTRDIRDPAQILTPARSAPVAGAPVGPGGPPPSMKPLN